MIDDATLLLLWGNTQGYVKEIERQHCQLYNTAALYHPRTHAEILVGCANVFFYFYFCVQISVLFSFFFLFASGPIKFF